MHKATVAIIGVSGIPARYGGFETFVDNWMRTTKNSRRYVVYCETKYRDLTFTSGALRRYIPMKSNGLQSLFYDVYGIFHSIILERVNVLVILGTSGAWILPLVNLLFPSKKIIINTDGLEWKRSKWSNLQKKLLKALEFCAVKYSDDVVVDNGALVEYLRLKYDVEPHLIAYGHEHCHPSGDLDGKINGGYFLSICRIEPENNCEIILSVFAEKPSQKLIFVGNWNYSEFARSLYRRFSGYPNISLIGPEYDPVKLERLRLECDAYIHGHSVGGTNPSLIEIMVYGKSIIAHDNEFNRWTLNNRADFFLEKEKLGELVDNYVHFDMSWSDLLEQHFCWNHVIDSYEALIDSKLPKE